MARTINAWIADQLKHFWKLLLLLFMGIGEILHIFGQQVGIETGIVMITILGFGIPEFIHIGKILCFVGQKVNMQTRVANLTFLGLDIQWFVEACRDGQPTTPGMQGDFRNLVYVIASALVVFSESPLMVGVACICAILEILIDLCSQLPWGYVSTLFASAIVVMFYGYTFDRAY